MKTNDIFIKAFNNSGFSQKKFGNIVGKTQPNIFSYIHKKFEIRYSEFERYMRVLGQEYEIVLKKDRNNLELFEELKKLEVKLIKEFSMENDYEKKLSLNKKIDAIKILIDI